MTGLSSHFECNESNSQASNSRALIIVPGLGHSDLSLWQIPHKYLHELSWSGYVDTDAQNYLTGWYAIRCDGVASEASAILAEVLLGA